MSTETKAPAKASNGAPAKAKAPAKKARTEAELKAGGLVGNLTIVINKVKSVCAAENFVGTELEGDKYAGNRLYRICQRGGALEMTDQKSEEFKALHAACKAAVVDLKAYPVDGKYTTKIKDVVKAALLLVPERAARSTNMSVLDDIKL